MRRLWICVVLIGCSVDPIPTSVPNNEIALIFENTNTERVKRNLPPYVMNLKLRRAAQNHAETMAKRRTLSHFFFDAPHGQRTPWERTKTEGYESGTVGENASMGSSAENVVDAWMHSPGHRAAILSREYNEIGIGIADSSGDRQTPFGCQVFGRSEMKDK